MPIKTNKRIIKFIGSKIFFTVVMIIFVVESLWIALLGNYPGAFDEAYHLGIIQLYAKQWSPFFTRQPVNTSQYGALSRDPSYLYHYLMSFPYRIAEHLSGNNLMAGVITLRIIDVALFAIGLVLFRKVLKKTKASDQIINLTLLFTILVPVVPLLAGQINYDDLLIPVIGLCLLLSLNFAEKLKKKDLNLNLLFSLIGASLLGSLVVFPFLPILTAIALFVIYQLVKFARANRKKLKALVKDAWHNTGRLKIITLALMILGVGLFMEAYGVNVIKYHNPVPQCGQVLGIKPCMAYGPWARNYNDAIHRAKINPDPFYFIGQWLYGMFQRAYFAISGPNNGYAQQLPLPIISIGSLIIFVFGLGLHIKYFRKIVIKDWALSFLLFAAFVYLCALFGRNYHDYLHLGQAVALNGRYLIPMIIPLLLAIGIAYEMFLKGKAKFSLILILATILIFLQGGGALTYIVGSTNSWYWPNTNKTLLKANHYVQDVFRSFTLR